MRLAVHFTGRLSLRAAYITATGSARHAPFIPKDPPTSFDSTRTFSRSVLKTALASCARIPITPWVGRVTVNLSAPASYSATTARGSMALTTMRVESTLMLVT